MSKLPGRAATLAVNSVATASPTTTTTSANAASAVTTVTTSTTITVGSHPANRSPVNAMAVQPAATSSAESSQSAGHHGVQATMTDLLEPPIGVTEIGPIPPPPMFSSPSPMLPPRGAHHPAPPPTHGIHLTHLAPPAVAASSPNMLTGVSHDLSDLQDDDVPEESVDDSDSERGIPPAASKPTGQIGICRLRELLLSNGRRNSKLDNRNFIGL